MLFASNAHVRHRVNRFALRYHEEPETHAHTRRKNSIGSTGRTELRIPVRPPLLFRFSRTKHQLLNKGGSAEPVTLATTRAGLRTPEMRVESKTIDVIFAPGGALAASAKSRRAADAPGPGAGLTY